MMSNQNNIPQLRFHDFKGEWEKKTLSEISSKITDGTHDTPKPTKQGVPFLTAIHIKDGFVDYNNCYFLEQEVHNSIYKRCNPEKDDLLIVNIGAGTATCAINSVDYEFSLKNVALVKPNKKVLNGNFLAQIQRKKSSKIFNQLTSGGAQPFLSLKEIGRLKISFPTLPEQQKIASFLSAVDEKIQQLSRKKELLEQYKKGVMQQLFSGKLRFKDENGEDYPDWEEKKLGDLAYKVGKKNKENIQYPIYSINNKEGFLPQSEQFDGLDSNDRGYDISLYKIVEFETFAYNPARINVGSIGYSYNLQKVIVSSLYVCFKTLDKLEDLYLLAYLDTYNFKKEILRFEEGGVRQYLFYENFSMIKIPLPSNIEQKKIANFLSSIDTKIENVNGEIGKTQLFKKGLLQQMFV